MIFFGTSPFAAKILTHLIHRGHVIKAVVTRPDKPKGRSGKPIPSAVKRATPEGIPLYQPEKASTDEFAKTLQSHNADLFLVAAYGEIISQKILDIPRHGCINVHPSLLPKYRGAAPIQAALLAGDSQTGVSIIEMVKAMDAGPILSQKKIAIPEDMTFPELEEALLHLSCAMLDDLLPKIATAERLPQKEGASYVKKITTDDCHIDWNRPAREIHNMVRALTPKPGAWTTLNSKRLKILLSRVVPALAHPPGTLLSSPKEGCVVGCGQGALEILELQLEGKKPMKSKDFSLGHSGLFFLEN